MPYGDFQWMEPLTPKLPISGSTITTLQREIITTTNPILIENGSGKLPSIPENNFSYGNPSSKLYWSTLPSSRRKSIIPIAAQFAINKLKLIYMHLETVDKSKSFGAP